MINDMADGKITIYGELESGVPNGKIVDYSLVANTPEIYTKQEIDDKFENISGGGGTPSGDLSEYAKTAYVDEEVQKAKDYTDEQITNSGYATEDYVDTKVAESYASANENFATKQELDNKADKKDIPDVSGFATEAALGEFVNAIGEAFNDKVDKTSVIKSDDINNVTLDWDKEYHFTMTKDTSLGVYDKPDDDYAHSIEIEMVTGEEIYSFSTKREIQWVKDLEIEPNKRYMIIIDDSMTAMWVAVERSDNE